MPDFKITLGAILGLAVLCAVMALFLTVFGGSHPSPLLVDLAHNFMEGFKACLFTVLGLFGGKALQTQRAKRKTKDG
jgi:hypothetical protein